MVEYIALGLVVLKYVLDYLAPKTKTKADDVARDVMSHLPLPSIQDAGKAALDKATKPERKAPEPGSVPSRDHRVPPPK